MKHILILLLPLLFYSCDHSTNSTNKNSIIAEINVLKTVEEKDKFLYNLWQEDQKFRKGEEGDLIAKFGYKSKEHKAYLEKWENNDKEVFQKLKNYLQVHGYPKDKSKYHELSLNAFPIIIGHNHNFKAQKELLPYIHQAYKSGHCDLDDVIWVLGEMYESKNRGRRYNMKSDRFTPEQEFKELVEALNLNLDL